jgi:hypothetical protein
MSVQPLMVWRSGGVMSTITVVSARLVTDIPEVGDA